MDLTNGLLYNQPKMARFLKFKLLFTLESYLNGEVNFIKKYPNFGISKSGKKSEQGRISLSKIFNK